MSTVKSKVVTTIGDNKITISFFGIITSRELGSIYTDVRFGVADLKPGFNVLADFTDCKFLYLNGLITFRKIFSFLLPSECGEMIRIIDHNRVGI